MRLNSPEHKIIILCGGQGKRLGNITNKIPKPLVHVRGKPLLQNVIDFVLNLKCVNYIS